MSNIITTKAPNLTFPKKEYTYEQQLQLTNQLRLYFNQLDNTNNEIKTSVDTLVTLNWIGDN
jgi:hypothetical protein|tara:strand:- start:13 stop:198 length:186 start_codon:yes stop_codon:yes gene_type:complete